MPHLPHLPPPDHTDLDVTGRRRRWWRWLPVALVVLLVLGWWLTHAAAMEAGGAASAETQAGKPVYVGLRSAPGHTVHVRSVSIDWKGGHAGAAWTAYVCHDGAIAVTADPRSWCRELVPAEGATLDTDHDQLVIAVESRREQTVRIREVRVAYREGIQWATQPTGPAIEVTIEG